MEVITLEKGAFKKLISDNIEMKQMLILLCDKVDKLARTKTEKVIQEYVTVKEAAHSVRKSRKTITNYCNEYPEIRRKKEGRENLVHQNDFQKAYENDRKIPFDREVFNRKNMA